jgi:Arm DNA-binding domain
MKLTAKTVAALKLDGKRDVIHFDDQLSGFGYRLRAGAGGKVLRSWVVQYRRGGASRRLLLGSAAALSAEQARTMAKKALGLIAHGADPQADRADRRAKDKHTRDRRVSRREKGPSPHPGRVQALPFGLL